MKEVNINIEHPKQGEIWQVDFRPTRGREQDGVRPALIISGDTMNANFELFLACPITSSLKEYRAVIDIDATKETGLTKKSQALVFQVRALDRDRFIRKRGAVNHATVELALDELAKVCRY